MKELFSGATEVAIQGDRVLRFLDCTGNQAKYEVIGFEHLPLLLIDTRQAGLQAIQELLATNDLAAFAPKFNSPAYVRVFEDETGCVVVELNDTEHLPHHLLWIAIGLQDSLPVYPYIYENIAALESESGCAFIGVYPFSASDRPSASSSQRSISSAISSGPAWAG